MTRRCSTFYAARALAPAAVAFSLSLAAVGAFAQASVPLAQPELPELPGPSASAPAGPIGQTGPRAQRLRSPLETGERAAAPGDLRPERPVAPQINIPLGKKAPPAPRQEGATRSGNPAANATIDDDAARCESQVDDQVRATCRAKLAREAKNRLPS